ncbi:MAG: hypothetical protein QOG64_1233, partial [Acidimicrobiaceae bacterium]|nr:hypothetical protein [Acidimicrobiaceae bacterium]
LPVVLLPLVAIGTVAMAFSAAVRARIGWIVVALAGIALVGVQLAIGSGQALKDAVPRSHALSRHTDMAEMLRPLAFVLLLAVLAMMLLDRRRTRTGRTVPRAALVGLAAFSVVMAATTTGWVVVVGHNGARATWQRTQLGSNGEGGNNATAPTDRGNG